MPDLSHITHILLPLAAMLLLLGQQAFVAVRRVWLAESREVARLLGHADRVFRNPVVEKPVIRICTQLI